MAQSIGDARLGGARKVISAFAVPWNAFVAVFLYYTVLTLVAVGGASIPALAMLVSYGLPVALYVAWLVSRAVHALAVLPVEIGETPHALAR